MMLDYAGDHVAVIISLQTSIKGGERRNGGGSRLHTSKLYFLHLNSLVFACSLFIIIVSSLSINTNHFYSLILISEWISWSINYVIKKISRSSFLAVIY